MTKQDLNCGTTTRARAGSEADTPLAIDLAGIFARHERVFLGFSGGKESVALADLVLPWAARVTLVWLNTGVTLPHMPAFVRRYGERFTLVEVTTPNVAQSWRDFGIPTDTLPLRNAHGGRWPKMQLWHGCCLRVRNLPLFACLSQFPGSLLLLGQRLQDKAFLDVQALKTLLPDGVEVAFPLWDWTESDVFRYIEQHGLELPHQYANDLKSSGDCAVCHASELTAAKLSYLDRFLPEIAAIVRQNAAGVLLEAQTALDETATLLGLPVRRP